MDGVTLEQAVAIIRRECSRHTHGAVVDLESDLIFKVWFEERQFNDLQHVACWTRSWIRRLLTWGNGRSHRSTFLFTELWTNQTDRDDDAGLMDLIVQGIPPQQENAVEVKMIRKMVRKWPHIHRTIVMILGEGGSVLDVSRDLGIPPAQALRYLRECQQFMANGNSLLPLKEAA